jgi:hypothetical protein
MIWVTLATEAVAWSAWLWQHRKTFQPILDRVGGAANFAQAALADATGSLRRVGNMLVFGQADGGPKVIAFIEQTSPRVESIEHAVNGLQAGQTVLSSSLASLQTMSMVTLGLTALTPAVLAVQFIALNRKLNTLQKLIADLHKKFDATNIADLRTGLDMLRQGQDFLEAGNRPDASNRLTAALPFCIHTMKYFSELLGSELNQKKVNRDEVRLLARHLSVAVAAVASCQIRLEKDQHAFAQSGHELELLRNATRWIFHETVARDPTPYMLPSLCEHGITIEFMANLYQQARDAGALESTKDCSVAAWFEEHRKQIFNARQPWSGWKTNTLLVRLQEAVAAVEETNRVIGLSRLVEEARCSCQTTLAVMEEYKQNANCHIEGSCPYMAWGNPERVPCTSPL